MAATAPLRARLEADVIGPASPPGPWRRLRWGSGGAASVLEQRRVLDAMRDLLRIRAIQAAGWRAAGLPVEEVRVVVYVHGEADVVVWYLNEAGFSLYRSAGGSGGPLARVDALPTGRELDLALDAVDHYLR
jgi:hypothetical protein